MSQNCTLRHVMNLNVREGSASAIPGNKEKYILGYITHICIISHFHRILANDTFSGKWSERNADFYRVKTIFSIERTDQYNKNNEHDNI